MNTYGNEVPPILPDLKTCIMTCIRLKKEAAYGDNENTNAEIKKVLNEILDMPEFTTPMLTMPNIKNPFNTVSITNATTSVFDSVKNAPNTISTGFTNGFNSIKGMLGLKGGRNTNRKRIMRKKTRRYRH